MKSVSRSVLVFLLVLMLTACSAPTQPKPEAVVFGDPALEAKVRTAMKIPEGDISVSQAQAVTELDLSNEWQPQLPEVLQIKDVSALKYFVKLTTLNLTFNKITDVSVLASLIELESLQLGGNSIIDISALSKLTRLRELYIWGNRDISDISPLADIIHLHTLFMGGNQISDISVLANMKGIDLLDISSNVVEDISALAGLPLTRLKLNGNPIKDFSPIEDIYPLLTEKDFEILSAHDVPDEPIVIADPLFEAALRVAMDIHDRPITQKDAYLVQSLGVYSEKVPGAQFTDISPLAYFVNLTSLEFNSNLISDLTPLRGLTKLKSLKVSFNRITDINPLASLTELENLDLMYNQINDVRPLAGLKSLRHVQIRENPITDYSPLKDIYPTLITKDFELK